METFTNIIWWYGVILFTVSVALFYGLLTYTIVKGILESRKK